MTYSRFWRIMTDLIVRRVEGDDFGRLLVKKILRDDIYDINDILLLHGKHFCLLDDWDMTKWAK